jgi:hypothetical protein
MCAASRSSAAYDRAGMSDTLLGVIVGGLLTGAFLIGAQVLDGRSRAADREAQRKEAAEQHRRNLETTSIAVRQAVHDAARERLRAKLEPIMELGYELRTDVERGVEEARVMYDRSKVVVEASRGGLALEPRGVDLVQCLDWLQSRVAIYWQTSEMYQKVLDQKLTPDAPYYERLEESRQVVREAIKELQVAARQALDDLSRPVADTHSAGPTP